MITAKNLNFNYGLFRPKEDRFAIRDVSLEIKPGFISCLLGNNGAGKTTLLSLLYGFINPKSGIVCYDGRPIDRKNIASYHRDVAYCGEKWCADGLTVEKNAEMLSTLYPAFSKELFNKYMEIAQADRTYDKTFGELSTGQKVKVEIAFLLARKPKFILMDEPLANVDPVFKTDILEILQNSVAENGTGVFLSTHLLDEITDIVDYIYVLKNGSLIKQGSRLELLDDGHGSLKDIMSL